MWLPHYKLVPCRVLFVKLIVTQLLKKFPAFYRTWRFITVFTTAHHWHLSWARCIQSTTSHPFSLRSASILSSHLRIRWCIQKFPDWVDNEINNNKHSLIINTNVMVAKLTTLTHRIAIQLHLVAERCILCSSRSRRPVRQLLDTPS
jgi:hypothetical protein